MSGASRIETIARFHSDCLDNERDIFVYLPPSYDRQPENDYPVLYIHDGQNVFHPAFNGQSWNLHEICDSLIARQRIQEIIIVAIANMGMERSSEFAHGGLHADSLEYACRGELYENFLVEELKPFIDRKYRTKRDSSHTALMGSSRGGLVTYHVGFRRPDVFGKLAMISPYFAQYNEADMTHLPIVQHFDKIGPQQLWIDTGGMEGMTVLVSHVREMVRRFLDLGYRSGEDLMFCYEPLAEHSEEAWERRAHAPLIYFFGEKGVPTSSQLIGDDIAAVHGARSYVYPILCYESGLNIVDLDARFTITPNDFALVTPEGLIMAWDAGECEIEYVHPVLSVSKKVSVVPALPDAVTVEIEVDVPPSTEPGARVYAGVELERTGPHKFRRRFTLPRGCGFAFRICEYSGLQEADSSGNNIPKRTFIAYNDILLNYEVQSWVQVQTL